MSIHNSGTRLLKLNYLVLPHSHRINFEVYPLEISRMASVAKLVDKIRQEQASMGPDITLFMSPAIPLEPNESFYRGVKSLELYREDALRLIQKLSTLFSTDPSEDVVHIIAVSQTQTLTLNYILVNFVIMEPSYVQISRNETVEALKNMINEKAKLSTSANALQIWKLAESVRIDDEEACEKLSQEWPKSKTHWHLVAPQRLDEIFPIISNSSVIHIAVKAPSPRK
jgi:hypothetical protein